MSDIVERLRREKERHQLGVPSDNHSVAVLLYDAAITLSEAEQRVKDARREALEEAAKVADTEEELLGNPPAHVVAAMEAVGPVGNARSAVRVTKASIAKRIRALQSEAS